MSVPTRVQRRRTKGWKKPAEAVYVGRGSKWGNPWVVDATKATKPATNQYRETAGETVDLYRDWISYDVDAVKAQLAGKDLMCWCPLTQPCHADVLLELANGDRLPVGTPVLYWPGARVGDGRLSITRTPIWKVGSGTEVVSVQGYAGGIALSHIQPVGQDPEGVALVRAIHERKVKA